MGRHYSPEEVTPGCILLSTGERIPSEKCGPLAGIILSRFFENPFVRIYLEKWCLSVRESEDNTNVLELSYSPSTKNGIENIDFGDAQGLCLDLWKDPNTKTIFTDLGLMVAE